MDVILLSEGIGRTTYRDYATIMVGSGQIDLWVALHPCISTTTEIHDAILNGLEVFKLQKYGSNSLAGLNPPLITSPDVEPEPSGRRNSKGARPAAVGGAIGSFVVLMACAGVCITYTYRRKEKAKREYTSRARCLVPLTEWNRLPSRSNLCRRFTIKEIQDATGNFDETFLLGKGGFGNVYHGKIGGGIKVAIKRGNPLSQQGLHEFRTEIETLSMLRHRHLVSLVGYCQEKK